MSAQPHTSHDDRDNNGQGNDGDGRTVTIVINAREHTVTSKELTFEHLVA